MPLSAGLYLVAVPIGNARDITLRALDILRDADVLAAEDTRTLRHLMQIHGLSLGGRQIVAAHDHAGPQVLTRLVAAAEAGQSVAFAAEAGTPLLSDPGFALTRAFQARGLPVTAAPGASALLAALCVAGLPAERFLFLGFLPAARSARQAAIAAVVREDFSLVLYESPKRVNETLQDLADGLGAARPAALCRELTKRFEEVRRGSLGELAAEYADVAVKGEVVLVIGPPVAASADPADVIAALRQAMVTMRIKDAADSVAGAFGLPRRAVYQMALGLEDKE